MPRTQNCYFFAPCGQTKGRTGGVADVPSMALEGVQSCRAAGMGGAEPRWSYTVGGVSAVTPRRVTTPPARAACGGARVPTDRQPRNALGMVATPPGNPWGVAVTMGVWLVPMGAGAARGRGVGVARRTRAFQDAGATSPNALGGCAPYSGLPTVIHVGFVGGTRKHAGAAS